MGRAVWTRRQFLGAAAATAGLVGALDAGLVAALAEPRRRGSVDDIEHVVILMQENRSFDHYYGTMRGVRGFGDRTAIELPSGRSVLYQPDPERLDGGYLLPFHLDTTKVDGQQMGDLLHDWDTTHVAWDGGRYNEWVQAKTAMTMAYFEASDIPFQRALAQAFTTCDRYHCSVLGPTIPNRLYHWTGTIDPHGHAGGPATENPTDYVPVYNWPTYPERLQAAGISWQVYANGEVGDSNATPQEFVGDYGDNPLWLFDVYHQALASTDPKVHQLAERASLRTRWLPYSGLGFDVNHVIAEFAADCKAGTLPAVSWVVAPQGYSEHPAARPVDGAAYVQGVLHALWDNPKLWESTVVFLNYDENDGLFDHVPPPTPPPGTPDEFVDYVQPIYDGFPPAAGPPTPIGLGPRVPMTVVSPWTRGGWVNSQVFDHTSVLRFLERWTGVAEPNISAWRRSICGDLTSCFDFTSSVTTIPLLPDAAALRSRADQVDPTLAKPTTPASGAQVAPLQEPGSALARPIPYQALVNFVVEGQEVTINMANSGDVALSLAVYPRFTAASSPRSYDVDRYGQASGAAPLDPVGGTYDVTVHGPNGFLARAAGDGVTTRRGVEALLSITGPAGHPILHMQLVNGGSLPVIVFVTTLDGSTQAIALVGGGVWSTSWDPIAEAHGWYDVALALDGHPSFVRHFAGHLENGLPSLTG